MTKSAPSKLSGDRLSGLDILRGLAALAVVLFHYTSKFPDFYDASETVSFEMSLGFYGVHLFFLVSGFVILMSLSARGGEGFIRSRFIRLYPLFWFSVLLTSVILLLFPAVPSAISPTVFAINLTMLQDYLKMPAIDGVYWSLSYELGFYAFAYAVFRLAGEQAMRFLPLYMALGAVLYYFGSAFIPHPLQYLLMVNAYGHLFGAGMAFFLIRRDGMASLYLFPILAVPVVQFLYDGATGFVVGSLIVAMMAWGVMRSNPFGIKGSNVFIVRTLMGLGAISYALYLTHQMIGYVILGTLDTYGMDPVLALALTLIVVVTLAVALTFGVERPFANLLKRKLPRTFFPVALQSRTDTI